MNSEFLLSTLRSSPNAILIVDKNCVVVFANDAYLRLFDIRQADILGKDWNLCKRDSKLAQILCTGQPMVDLNASTGLDAQKRYHHYAGVGLYVSLYPIRDSSGEIAGAAALYYEIRELQQRMQAFEQQLGKYGNAIRHQYRAVYTVDNIIGCSAAITQAKSNMRRLAHGAASVLFRGESGTGKELFAQSLHNLSPRAGNPFVAISCPSLSETLAESELFGYEAGAFSGALKGGKIGFFEIADGGTIFLDEIGDLSSGLQAKILRVLETGEFFRVGGVKPIKVDVRLISATNRNLEQMIREGKFREDLYFRLCTITMDIPPLRQRGEDILLIAEHIMESQPGGRWQLSEQAERCLMQHDWPGNIRELRNVLITMMNFSQDSLLLPEHLPQYMQAKLLGGKSGGESRAGSPSDSAPPLFPHLTGKKRQQALQLYYLLEKYGYSIEGKKKAAQEAEICLATLYSRIREFGIT